jgi:hypothetical protein
MYCEQCLLCTWERKSNAGVKWVQLNTIMQISVIANLTIKLFRGYYQILRCRLSYSIQILVSKTVTFWMVIPNKLLRGSCTYIKSKVLFCNRVVL